MILKYYGFLQHYPLLWIVLKKSTVEQHYPLLFSTFRDSNFLRYHLLQFKHLTTIRNWWHELVSVNGITQKYSGENSIPLVIVSVTFLDRASWNLSNWIKHWSPTENFFFTKSNPGTTWGHMCTFGIAKCFPFRSHLPHIGIPCECLFNKWVCIETGFRTVGLWNRVPDWGPVETGFRIGQDRKQKRLQGTTGVCRTMIAQKPTSQLSKSDGTTHL